MQSLWLCLRLSPWHEPLFNCKDCRQYTLVRWHLTVTHSKMWPWDTPWHLVKRDHVARTKWPKSEVPAVYFSFVSVAAIKHPVLSNLEEDRSCWLTVPDYSQHYRPVGATGTPPCCLSQLQAKVERKGIQTLSALRQPRAQSQGLAPVTVVWIFPHQIDNASQTCPQAKQTWKVSSWDSLSPCDSKVSRWQLKPNTHVDYLS